MKVVALCPELTPTIVARSNQPYELVGGALPPSSPPPGLGAAAASSALFVEQLIVRVRWCLNRSRLRFFARGHPTTDLLWF